MEGLVWEGSVDSPSPWTNIYIDPPFSDTWVLNNDGACQTSITAPTTVPTLETDPVNDRSLPQHSGLNKRGSDDVDTTEGSFPDPGLTIPKRRRLENSNYNLPATASSSISFQLSSPSSSTDQGEADQEGIAQMKEMIYCAAAFRPVSFGPEAVEKPQRKNVRTSSDPQTVAARQRRERISDRMRVLQRIVPGGTKMDTASMLDEAANYLKFLQTQIEVLGAPKFLDSSSTLTTNCNLLSWSRSL